MNEERRIWVADQGCIGCRLCERACPTGAITVTGKRARIDYRLCLSCGMCATTCRKSVIHDALGIYAPAE